MIRHTIDEEKQNVIQYKNAKKALDCIERSMAKNRIDFCEELEHGLWKSARSWDKHVAPQIEFGDLWNKKALYYLAQEPHFISCNVKWHLASNGRFFFFRLDNVVAELFLTSERPDASRKGWWSNDTMHDLRVIAHHMFTFEGNVEMQDGVPLLHWGGKFDWHDTEQTLCLANAFEFGPVVVSHLAVFIDSYNNGTAKLDGLYNERYAG